MASQPMSRRAKIIVLTAVMASLLEIIDTSIVNVAVPTMMGSLGATLDEISWVITGYIIANAIVLPIAGWMSQQLGRKFYYTSCIILFTVASVACGLAPNLPTLVVFRIIQGFAGGALLPTSQALIYESFPKEQAGMASAIYGMSVMVGPTLGPTLGGYLTDTLGWRSIFNINLPIGIVVALLSYLFVEDIGYDPARPETKVTRSNRQRTPVDATGLILLITGIGSLQFVLERGHAEDWFASGWIVLTTFTAISGVVGLIWWELKKAKHPILELHHFTNQSFRSGVILMAAMGGMLYGLIFMIPIFVNTVQGLDATQTGMLFIPGALASAAMMPLIGNQLRKRDPRWLILIGVLGLATGAAFIGRFDSNTSTDGMFWPLLIRGAAMAFLFVPINTTVLSQFSGAAIGQAAGMLNLCRQLGGSVGIALLSTLFQQFNDQAYARLSESVTALRPNVLRIAQTLQNSMHGKLQNEVGMVMNSAASHIPNSVKILYFITKKQAFVLAFQRVMVIAVVIFLFALIPLIKMKVQRRKPSDGPEPIIDAH